MIASRFTIGVATLAIAGAAYAAISPVLPFQEPVQATRQHKMLLQGAGEWEGTMTMWMPGMDAQEVECTESVTAIGDLWTTSQFHCNLMGMEFHGSMTTGFDPEKKQFVGIWVDSMTPSMTHMHGEFDADKKAIVMHYDYPDPETGEMGKKRIETVQEGDSYTSTFYVVSDAGDQREMQIKMTRKAAVEAGSRR